MRFHLFRIKIFLPTQRDAFADALSPSNILVAAVQEKPSLRGGRSQLWHIGNVEAVEPGGWYFRIGRRSVSRVSDIDTNTGDFVELDYPSAPYTDAILDASTEVCAVRYEREVSIYINSIANRLRDVLASSNAVRGQAAEVHISPLSEVDDFLKKLEQAINVTRFTVTFTRPNSIDVNEDIVRPTQRAAQALNANGGELTIRGESLDVIGLTDVARSAAATGDDARASVVERKGRRPITRHLRGDSAVVDIDDIESPEQKVAALEQVAQKHRRIRDG